MAYKMKGSPMQRNFGVGSPLHDEKDKEKKKPKVIKEIDPKDLGKYQKPAEGFKWVMLDGKPSQVKI